MTLRSIILVKQYYGVDEYIKAYEGRFYPLPDKYYWDTPNFELVHDPYSKKKRLVGRNWDLPPFRIAAVDHFSVPANLLELRILVHEVQGCSYPKLKEQEKYFSGSVVELTLLRQIISKGINVSDESDLL
ncbi:hypothetical protein BUALT_Bualt01G0130700 [Buddleja alternifolia]|uniref:Uncharacterized protein n=1 Tax=Buddleja alternifolia TaxID=168488 RepID=A0AAV6Y6R5_9LAMI|nr:hypothetical protein BUALT_Bualt01G0130700 [Buddleja alternifolia]